ncbi:hypothetical protein O181_058962 [Austropuccinia psidii MF-1]|uniref:Uncharacterized protein n=1 Tax=Austropuccinia psidii MF-1 TaxID=1389203 RepID=A0A9Q3EFR6_9BASI|nr:hypothetical protein [Austropuccinia psidii MF-1]
MDCGLWPKKAIEALDPIFKGVGPKALVMTRGARSSLKTRWTPQAQKKGIGLGVGEVENWPKGPIVSGYGLGLYVDSERWYGPKAIKHQSGQIRHETDDMANWP